MIKKKAHLCRLLPTLDALTYNVLSYISAEMMRTLQKPFFKSSLCGRYWYSIMKLGGRSQAIRQVTDAAWGGMSYIFNLLPKFI